MSTVEEIEAAILSLPPRDIRRLADWLAELDWQQWDKELEKDIAEGKLDRIAEDALRQYRAGQYKTL